MKEITSAKVFLRNPDGDILLLKRSTNDDHRPGQWDLPGGGVGVGETPIIAAVREIREETGIDIDESAVEPLLQINSPSTSGEVLHHRNFFAGRVSAGQEVIVSFEHNDYAWTPPVNAVQLITHPPHIEALARLIESNL